MALRAFLLLLTGWIAFAQTKDLCANRPSQPGCVLPELYGPTGLTLPNPFHQAHFNNSFQADFTALNSAIATQLAVLPLISPASGFTYKFDSAAGVFVRSSTSFGPVFTERAETVGRGKVSFGAAYQRFRFSNLDGQDIHKLPEIFRHRPGTAPDGTPQPYEQDIISTINNVDLKIDQTTLFATVGVTDRLDFSIAVPILSTRLGVTSNASINRVAPPDPVFGQAHYFDPADPQNSTHKTFTNSGSAAGIGDVVFRLKAGVFNSDKLRLAVLADIRAPSGDARSFLGTGALGIKPFVALSFGKRWSPHVNAGYQWNGQSVLAGDLSTGEKRGLPDQFFYSIGTDAGVTKRLTVSFDYLGQTLFNAPRVFSAPFASTGGQNFPAQTFPGLGNGTETFGLNNGAAGVKYNLFGKLLVIGNLLVSFDNNGLRQRVTPMIAVTYALGQ